MKKILVLGIKGMLGSMVYSYLKMNATLGIGGAFRGSANGYFFAKDNNLFEFDARKDVRQQMKDIFAIFQPDYIINCIGIIKPHCPDNDMTGVYNAILVNSAFPHQLSNAIRDLSSESRIIQIATDCVYSGKSGMYDEGAKHDALDVYGKTKSLGEVIAENLLNIRCSIIGPELQGKFSLIEWFLSNPPGSVLKGFSHHKWNGVTTLQYAQLCEKLIVHEGFDAWRNLNSVVHYITNETVNKFTLLSILTKAFDRDYHIENVHDVGEPVDRTISSRYLPMEAFPMNKAIEDLIKFMNSTEVYH